MNQKYYTHNGTERKGAFTIDELKNQKITPETMVWCEGMQGWTKAEDVLELKELFIPAPPEFNQKPTPPVFKKDSPNNKIHSSNPINADKVNTNLNQTNSVNRNILIWSVVTLIVIGLISVIAVVVNKHPDAENSNSYTNTETSNPAQTQPNSSESKNVETSNNNTNQTTTTPTPTNSNNPPKPSNNSNQNNSVSTDQYIQTPDGILYYPNSNNDEETRENHKRWEIADFKERLSLTYSAKVNLAANTITEGDIMCLTSLASFKNIRIRLDFLSKTDMVLGSEDFIIMEFIEPQEKVHFRHKVKGYWKNATNVRATVISAEGY